MSKGAIFMSNLFSDRNRPIYIGRFPTNKYSRLCLDLKALAPWPVLDFQRPAGSGSIVPAMVEL